MTENEIGTEIVDCAIAVHRELGPGLLEHVHEIVLAKELEERGFQGAYAGFVLFAYLYLRG